MSGCHRCGSISRFLAQTPWSICRCQAAMLTNRTVLAAAAQSLRRLRWAFSSQRGTTTPLFRHISCLRGRRKLPTDCSRISHGITDLLLLNSAQFVWRTRGRFFYFFIFFGFFAQCKQILRGREWSHLLDCSSVSQQCAKSVITILASFFFFGS